MNKSDAEVTLSEHSEERNVNIDNETNIERDQNSIIDRRLVEKRMREDSDENQEEDGEFEVIRRNTKRLHRHTSQNETDYNLEKYEVVITSKQMLPKQMGLAKLLMKENINGVMTVKYKNPYRVILQLKNEEEMEKLCACNNFKELGYRCQSTQKISMSYGVVKNIDLDIDENELQKSFISDFEIISITRMKRFAEGKWVNSETVRVCFKGSTLPRMLIVTVAGLRWNRMSFQ